MELEGLNDLNIKIQEFLFKKSSKEEVLKYLTSKNLSIDTLIGNLLLYQGYEPSVDSLIAIVDKLFRWEEIKQDFINQLLHSSSSEAILAVKSPHVKKYLIDFITQNLNDFYNQEILYKLIKVYSIDENSGVFEKVLNLLITILTSKSNNEKYKNYLISNNLIMDLLTYLENIKGDNSIILIRELEIIMKYFSVVQGDSQVEGLLKSLASNFLNFDLLTQLTFLDTLEKNLDNPSIILAALKEINFFQSLQQGVNISNEVLRKTMYAFSKFYAGKCLTEANLIKNFLAVSLQYYEDNKEESYFIMSIILNTFHNREIYSFMMDPSNNLQLDFQGSYVQTIVENYFNFDPKVKQQTLEVISLMSNFHIPSMTQEQFFKKFLNAFYFYEYNKNPTNEGEMYTFFIERLYKDFRTHDYEEYELHFLNAILNMITFEPMLKKVVAHFDFILYLLNRRTRPEDICLAKFEIIKYISKSDYANSGQVDKNLLQQFGNYISKGPY